MERTFENRGKNILLKVEGLKKSYSGVTVLHGIDLSLPQGTVMGLIGENGAGKSTLIKCLNGVTLPDCGRIIFDGISYSSMTIEKALSLGIVTIPQEFNLANTLSVKDNVFLGCEIKKAGLLLDHKKMRQETEKLLTHLGCSHIDPDAGIDTLNVAQKQLVEIARGLNHKCRLFIMDEPTTVLNTKETEELFRIIAEMKKQGISVIYVSHKLHEISEICDIFTVLRDGEYITTENVKDSSTKEMANLMVGRQLKDIYPPKLKMENGNSCILELQNVSEETLVKNIDLKVSPGEILGFAGLGGAGRTELFEGVFGIRKFTEGKMFFKGQEIRNNSPALAVESGIAYLPEDRQKSGTVGSFPLSWNISLISLVKKYCCTLFIRKKAEKSSAEKYIDFFKIKTVSSETPIEKLSGGNQQKAVIAKSLDTNPSLFIFDEPTRGIDINSRSEIYFFIHDLARQGTACIIISSDLEELIGLCPRIAVMREGKIAGILDDEKRINEKEIMYLATGIK